VRVTEEGDSSKAGSLLALTSKLSVTESIITVRSSHYDIAGASLCRIIVYY